MNGNEQRNTGASGAGGGKTGKAANFYKLLFVAFCLSIVFYYFYKNSTSKIVHDALEKAWLDNSITEINFAEEIDKRITKICIQTPYLPENDFEVYVGDNLKDYKIIGDEKNVLWLFYADKSTIQVSTGRWKMPGSKKCSSDKPTLYFKRDNDVVYYYLK